VGGPGNTIGEQLAAAVKNGAKDSAAEVIKNLLVGALQLGGAAIGMAVS